MYIAISEKSTKIVEKFGPTIELDDKKDWEMALVSLETYYSFPNIDSSNNNFRYSPDDGTTWKDITIPEGSYEISEINNYIQEIMYYNNNDKENSITIGANNSTLRSFIKLTAHYQVDFTTPNSVRTVLGFNSQVYSIGGKYASENIVNLLHINSIRVKNSIIGGSYVRGTTDNVIYSFFPNVDPGYKIVEKPHNLIYLPVIMKKISQMETSLVDQDGKLLNLRGEELSITFHIREVK